jgi:hypothetical protein
MVQGLPFDMSDDGDGKDYTLDTTVVSEDDEDAPFDEDIEAKNLLRFQQARAERNRLVQEGVKTVEEFGNFLEKLKGLSHDADSRPEHDRIKTHNEELRKLRDRIKEQEIIESTTEMELLQSTTKKTSYEIKKAIKEKDIEQVYHAVSAAESVDLAFILDATTSMTRMIASVKDNIREIVAQVRRTNINLKLRLAVVVYRDLEYYEPFQVLDFVPNIEEFETFMGSIQCVGEAGRSGPRDTPEDMAGGIKKANRLAWKNLTRVAFLIADSPCHGREYHSFEDNFPAGTPGINIQNEMRTLMDKGGNGTMSVFFGRMTSRTEKMLDRFEKYGISLNVVGVKDPKAVVSAVTKGVRSSIFKTITATNRCSSSPFSLGRVSFNAESLLKNSAGGRRQARDPKAQLKQYSIIPRLPSIAEWKNQPAVLVKVYNNKPINSMADVRKPLPVGVLNYFRQKVSSILWKKDEEPSTKESTMVLRRAAAPFAEGTMRIAFHGQLARNEDELSLENSNVVMKTFKHAGQELNGLKQYLRQMELSNIANFLAKEYNKCRPLSCGSVHVLKSCVVEEEEEVNEGKGSRRFCAEEPLPGDLSRFTKFCNNTGYWNVDDMHETLLRFTHFTFTTTDGYLLVTDLQGVKVGNDFYLTDPAILCTDMLRFGHTNLGEKFMKKCIDATNHHLAECGWS